MLRPLLLVVSLLVGCTEAFRIQSARKTVMNMSLFGQHQGPLLKRISAAVCASSLLLSSMNGPVLAAVGEGDLPEGAMAFSKLLKYQSEWDKLANSIKSRTSEIDERETQGIKVFLKQLANEYSDMELLGKGIMDPAKAESAKSIAKNFRKQIRECDDAASEKNFAKILEIYPTTATELKDFLGLMQDVPDEI
jgi:hypothetical protein